MKRLQVLNGDKWEYVFCYNRDNKIITTKWKEKALTAQDLDYFKKRFWDKEFRIV